MGPETEKRAPSAKNIKKNLWRLPAIAAVAVSAGVYNEKDLPINPPPQSDSTHTIVLGKNNFTPSWENPLISPLPQADISQTLPEDLLPDEMIASQENTVKKGDYLSKISQEVYGTESLWPVLAHVNNINNPNIIHVGNVLIIPPKEEAEKLISSIPTANQKLQAASTPAISDVSLWDRIAQCESSGDWPANTGNGFFGGLQFHPKTWADYGGLEFAPSAQLATKEQQIIVAERVAYTGYGNKAPQGLGAWPNCP